MGLILGEATKRAFKSVGLASQSKELVPFAHSSLSEPAALASQVAFLTLVCLFFGLNLIFISFIVVGCSRNRIIR